MQDLRYYVDVPAGMEKRAVAVDGVNKPMLQLLDSINGAFRPGAQQQSWLGMLTSSCNSLVLASR